MTYTVKATCKGGREGRAMLDNGGLALAMSFPKELGGNGEAHNPEQLFAIGYASCFNQAVIALAKKHGVWLDMDIYNGDWIEEIGTKEGWPAEYLRKNRETTDVQRQGFAAAVKAGAKMTFGTDAAVYPYGVGARQFAYMVRYGMTPLQAIQSATIEAARALRKEGEVGSLRPGAWGDLMAVRQDPLADITALEKVEDVIKSGELIR